MATERSRTGLPVTSSPSTRTLPEVGASNPAKRRMIEVLPESVGPSRILIVPGAKDKETSRTCTLPCTTLVTFSTVIVTVPPSIPAGCYRLRGFRRAIAQELEFAAASAAGQASTGARRYRQPFAPIRWRQGTALRPRRARLRNRVRARAGRRRRREPMSPACHRPRLAAKHGPASRNGYARAI